MRAGRALGVVAVVIAALGTRAAAKPANGKKSEKVPLAECQAKVDALKTFLDAAAEEERHTANCQDCTLPPLSLSKGKSPAYPAATVQVKAGGISVGGQGGVPLPTADDARVTEVLAAINSTPEMQFLKGNANAAARGIVIGAAPDAPWELVVTAATAAARSRERVWLLFRPEDSKIAPPPPSPLSRALGQARDKSRPQQERSEDFFQALKKEIAPCPAIRGVLGSMAGQALKNRMKYMADRMPAAVAGCGCDPDPASLATLAYEGIEAAAVAVEVPLAATPSGKAGDVSFARATPWQAAYLTVIEKAEQAKGEPLRLRIDASGNKKR